MKYEKLKALLSVNEVFREFIRALPNQEGEKGIADGEKVDDALSPYSMLPNVFHLIGPINAGHIDIVKAILSAEGTIERFYLLTIIPEEAREQNQNLALVQLNKQMIYYAWAINRIVEVYARTFLTVVDEEREGSVATIPLHWKNVYIGEKPFEGTTCIQQHYPDDKGLTLNVNLVDLMRLDRRPIIEKVLDAYAEEIAEAGTEQSEDS